MNIFKNFFNLMKNKSEDSEYKKKYIDSSIDNFFLNYDSDSFFNNDSASENYVNNPIVFRAVNLLCLSSSSVELKAIECDLKNGKEYELSENNPLSKLLKTPNFFTHCSEFIEKIVYNFIVYGNVFFLKINYQGLPREIHILNQSQVQILTNSLNGKVYGYRLENFNNKDLSKEYLIDQISGDCDILHFKNLLGWKNNLYGVSSIEPIVKHIQYHNNMISWNSSMLKNGARPSGAFFVKDDKSGNFQYLSSQQIEEIQNQIQRYSSPVNAGKPMIIQGPLEWKDFSIKPKDMDFINSDKILIKHIANALGVPTQLLGESDSASYNNFLEAKKMLFELSVLPLLNKIICSVYNHWICRPFNKKNSRISKTYFIKINEESISALSDKKTDKLKSLNDCNFITINEKRKQMGLDPIEGGDKLLK